MTLARKPLADQVLVITGATSGLGLALSRAAAKAGARLVLNARNLEALTTLAAELTAEGARVVAVAGDVADTAAVKALADEADQSFGGFDTWINNAGVSVYGRSWDVPLADQKRVFETNYWGAVHGTLTAVERLKARRGGGVIINVGSVLGDQAVPLQGAEAASKHALKAFTNALRMELIREAPEISLVLIKPSALDTPYKNHARNYLEHPAGYPPPAYDPELAARAILYAAENPVREITVGGAGRALALFGALAPRLAESVLAFAVPRFTEDKAEAHLADVDALHKPGRDLAVRSGAQHARRTSLWTTAQMNPKVTARAVVGAAMALVLALKLREALRLAQARNEGRRQVLAKINRKAEQQAARAAKRQAA